MAARLKIASLRAASIVVLILLWWAASVTIHDPQILPGPAAVARTIVMDFQKPGPLGESAYFDVGITLLRIFIAFAASMLAGIGIGLAMGLNRTCERSLLPLIPLMLTMPTILMVFLAIMWFGYSESGSLVAVMVVVTPYVAVNMYEGTKAMDKSLTRYTNRPPMPDVSLQTVHLARRVVALRCTGAYGTKSLATSANWISRSFAAGYLASVMPL